MKKLLLTLTLMLSVSAFNPCHAIDLGGGYTDTQTLKSDAHAQLIGFLGYKLPPYDNAEQKAHFEWKIVKIKKAVNTFISQKLELKAMTGQETSDEDKTLGEAVKSHIDGDSTLLKIWVNNNQTKEHFDDVPTGAVGADDDVDVDGDGKTDEMDDAADAPTLPDVPEDDGGVTTAPPLPTTPAPSLPPQPEIPTTDDDESSDISLDDDASESSEDDASESSEDDIEMIEKLEGQKEDYEEALEGIKKKSASYEKKLEKAKKKLKKYKKKLKKKKKKKYQKKADHYEELVGEYESKLRGLERATAKYQERLEAVNAEIAAL